MLDTKVSLIACIFFFHKRDLQLKNLLSFESKLYLMKHNLFMFATLVIFGCNAYSQNPLTDSLIAYYPFDGDALDASGNGNHGTANGATLTTDRFGNPTAAYKFDGVNDYIEYIAGSKYKPETFPVSLTAWIKPNTPSDVGTFFRNDNATNLYTGLIFQIQVSWGGVLEVHYGDGGTTSPEHRRSKGGIYPINDNQWHFIACVVRGPTDMDLYVDCGYDPGFYDGSGSDMEYTSANGASGIYDVVAGTYYYKGSMDELRFYHRELSLSDLQTIHSYPSPYGVLSVSLGADVSICSGGETTLAPTTVGDIQSYLWSDGSQSSTLTVNEPGQYWVSVFDGCSYANDTINVIMGKPVIVNLPEDTVICVGGSLLIDVGNFYDSYSWSTGETSASITITNPGTYAVTVETNGCFATDSISVIQVVCSGISEQDGINFSMVYEAETHTVQLVSGNDNYPNGISVDVLNALGQRVLETVTIPLTANASYTFQLPYNLPSCILILNAKSGSLSLSRKVIVYSK